MTLDDDVWKVEDLMNYRYIKKEVDSQDCADQVASGKVERLPESLVALNRIFEMLILGTVTLFNVITKREVTDNGIIHLSVCM